MPFRQGVYWPNVHYTQCRDCRDRFGSSFNARERRDMLTTAARAEGVPLDSFDHNTGQAINAEQPINAGTGSGVPCDFCEETDCDGGDECSARCLRCNSPFCENEDCQRCSQCNQVGCDGHCYYCERHGCYESSENHCVEVEDVEEIQHFDYKPEPNFHGDSEKAKHVHLGFELEVECNYIDRSAHVFSNFDVSGLIYLKSDGSIDHGFEIVTHPMTHEFAIHEFPWQILPELRSVGTRSESNCGLHVHVSRDGFEDPAHLYRWMKLFYRNADEIKELAGRSGDSWASFEGRNQRQNQVKFAKFVKKKTKLGQKEKVFPTLSDQELRQMYNLSRQEDVERYRRRYGQANPGAGSARYSAINCQNTATLEVRVFASSLDERVVRRSLDLVASTVEYTRDLTVRELVEKDGWSFDTFIEWLMEPDHKETYADLADSAPIQTFIQTKDARRAAALRRVEEARRAAARERQAVIRRKAKLREILGLGEAATLPEPGTNAYIPPPPTHPEEEPILAYVASDYSISMDGYPYPDPDSWDSAILSTQARYRQARAAQERSRRIRGAELEAYRMAREQYSESRRAGNRISRASITTGGFIFEFRFESYSGGEWIDSVRDEPTPEPTPEVTQEPTQVVERAPRVRDSHGRFARADGGNAATDAEALYAVRVARDILSGYSDNGYTLTNVGLNYVGNNVINYDITYDREGSL